ncbi:MAG: FMN-binding protein [Alphaproteobacteria bacterium]
MNFIRVIFAACFALVIQALAAGADVYQTPEKFLTQTFGAGKVPAPEIVWMTGALAAQAQAALGHKAAALRLRYWALGARSAWILDEIGKTEAITAGFVIENQKIAQVQVLEFRESRGGEVRHPFFTNQFIGLSLQEKGQLSEPVDGISGATLSVRAIESMAKLALVLARHVAPAPGRAP